VKIYVLAGLFDLNGNLSPMENISLVKKNSVKRKDHSVLEKEDFSIAQGRWNPY